jgi:hypothetical protein
MLLPLLPVLLLLLLLPPPNSTRSPTPVHWELDAICQSWIDPELIPSRRGHSVVEPVAVADFPVEKTTNPKKKPKKSKVYS